MTLVPGVIFGLVACGLVFWGWRQIPPEPRENVEARERYGKVGDPPR